MSFTLKEIVPWGRSFDEHLRMFALSEVDLRKRILGCGDGPASFNVGLTKAGGTIISIDPIYQFTVGQIQQRIDEVCPEIIGQLTENAEKYVWTTIRSPEELGRIRMEAMQDFLVDFPEGKNSGRYVEGELPGLPFANDQFDLALSSHFLLLYSEHLSADFHHKALSEIMRVAREARIFPILSLDGVQSPHLESLLKLANAEGWIYEVQEVDYEFQEGANKMLRIKRNA